MAVRHPQPESPTEDQRYKMINSTMRRHGFHPHALIESLHAVQDTFGYLDEEAMRYVAHALRIPLSQVYGVSTFYHFFKLKPQGEHSCVVCTGTACFIKGAGEILQAVGEEFNVKPDETTTDGKLSLITARCVGACGIAPVVVFDGKVAGKVTPEDAVKQIRRLIDHDA